MHSARATSGAPRLTCFLQCPHSRDPLHSYLLCKAWGTGGSKYHLVTLNRASVELGSLGHKAHILMWQTPPEHLVCIKNSCRSHMKMLLAFQRSPTICSNYVLKNDGWMDVVTDHSMFAVKEASQIILLKACPFIQSFSEGLPWTRCDDFI